MFSPLGYLGDALTGGFWEELAVGVLLVAGCDEAFAGSAKGILPLAYLDISIACAGRCGWAGLNIPDCWACPLLKMEGLVGSWYQHVSILIKLPKLCWPILTLRMVDWRIGGAIVGRTDGAGLCSSSVRLRLESPDGWIVLGLEGPGR